MSDATDIVQSGPKRRKHPAFQNLDPTTRFLYTPRTVTGLFIGMQIPSFLIFGKLAVLYFYSKAWEHMLGHIDLAVLYQACYNQF